MKSHCNVYVKNHIYQFDYEIIFITFLRKHYKCLNLLKTYIVAYPSCFAAWPVAIINLGNNRSAKQGRAIERSAALLSSNVALIKACRAASCMSWITINGAGNQKEYLRELKVVFRHTDRGFLI